MNDIHDYVKCRPIRILPENSTVFINGLRSKKTHDADGKGKTDMGLALFSEWRDDQLTNARLNADYPAKPGWHIVILQ